MTLLYPNETAALDEDLLLDEAPEPEQRPPARDERPPTGSSLERGHWILAALLAGAAAIHLTLVPAHWGEATSEGVAFLLAGLAQLGLAVWVAARPTKLALWTTMLVSAVCIGGWAVARTVGLPFGPGGTEDVTLVDGICVAFEAVAILLAGFLMIFRKSAFIRSSIFGVIGVLGVLALTGAALASPSAREHAAGGHSHGGEAAAAGDGHSHGGPAGEDDRGFSQLQNGQMGSHEHPGQGAATTAEEIDPTTAGELAGQLALTAPLVADFPTLGDARAAGLTQQGPFAPGLGLHVSGPCGSFNDDGLMDPADIACPTLIYDGLEDSSALAGFMYMAYQETEPEGFVGPLDRWHYHESVCIVSGPNGIETPFGADLTGVTDAMCEAEGGHMIDFTGYMVHVWTVPGYESNLGTFSDLNPAITCADGTYYTVPIRESSNPNSICKDAQTAA